MTAVMVKKAPAALAVHVHRNGTITVATRSPSLQRALRHALYLKRSANAPLWATHWTYLPDLRRDFAKYLHFTRTSAPNLRALVEEQRRREIGDDAEVLSVFKKELPPRPYQIKGIHCGLNCERLLLADDVGLGKTIQSTGMMLVLFKRRLIERCVIVCPASVKVQWYSEIHRFGAEHAVPEGVVVVNGSAAERRRIYGKNWRVLIVNPELLMRDAKALRQVADSVGLVILDEASCIRNSETKTAQSVKWLFPKTRFKLPLTATPLENNLNDLYSIFEWLDRRVFISKKYFEQRYVVWTVKVFRVRTRAGRMARVTKREPFQYRRLDEVRLKIKPRFLRRRVQDVDIELPEIIQKWEIIELPPKQREVYEAIKDEVKAKLAGVRGSAQLAPLIFLRQACDSTALVTTKKVRAKGKPAQVKIDRLKEMLSGELANERVLVFTEYERLVRIMMSELREFNPVAFTGAQNKRQREDALAAFRAGNRRVLLMTRAGSRGLNLQVAGFVVNVDMPWNPAEWKQRVGRARRIGSRHKTVRVINMVTADTLEERLIMQKLYSKHKLFEGVLGEDELSSGNTLERLVKMDLRKLL